MTTRVVVGSRVGVYGAGADARLAIRRLCEFANPRRAQLERLGKWTGREPEKIVTWREDGAWITVPRGSLLRVRQALLDAGEPFDDEDRTVAPRLGGDAPTPTGGLYGYQRRALDDLLRFFDGMLVAPPGAGKTNVLLTAAAELATPALVIVHTKTLLEQTCERARSWLGVEPGVVGAGRYSVGDEVTVATVQTLARLEDARFSEVATRHGTVVVDEVHHAPARTWTAMVDRLPARHRYGFTATPYRKDGLDRLIELAVGPVRVTIGADEVEEAGRIVSPSVRPVFTGCSYDTRGPDDWGRTLNEIAADDVRTSTVVRVVEDAMKAGSERVLVLTDRVSHVDNIAYFARDRGLRVASLTGRAGRVERASAMKSMGVPGTVTVATSQLLGEGVDVPGWDALVLASPMSRGPRVVQAIGRVARSAPGKVSAVVFDIVDDATPMLMNAWRGRRALYRRQGWKICSK